jgi:hypothetical protein
MGLMMSQLKKKIIDLRNIVNVWEFLERMNPQSKGKKG